MDGNDFIGVKSKLGGFLICGLIFLVLRMTIETTDGVIEAVVAYPAELGNALFEMGQVVGDLVADLFQVLRVEPVGAAVVAAQLPAVAAVVSPVEEPEFGPALHACLRPVVGHPFGRRLLQRHSSQAPRLLRALLLLLLLLLLPVLTSIKHGIRSGGTGAGR